MSFLQWRRFNFFDKEDIEFNQDVAQKLKKLTITVATHGRKSAIFGDSLGYLYFLTPNLELKSSKAHDGQIIYLFHMKNAHILLTIGMDISKLPIIKVWNLSKGMNRYGQIPCLKTVKLSSFATLNAHINCVAIHENMTLIALGLSDGQILCYRGNLVKDDKISTVTTSSTNRLRLFFQANSPITNLHFAYTQIYKQKLPTVEKTLHDKFLSQPSKQSQISSISSSDLKAQNISKPLNKHKDNTNNAMHSNSISLNNQTSKPTEMKDNMKIDPKPYPSTLNKKMVKIKQTIMYVTTLDGVYSFCVEDQNIPLVFSTRSLDGQSSPHIKHTILDANQGCAPHCATIITLPSSSTKLQQNSLKSGNESNDFMMSDLRESSAQNNFPPSLTSQPKPLSSTEETYFVVGRDQALFFYGPDCLGPCLAFEGKKLALSYMPDTKYLVVVDSKPNVDSSLNNSSFYIEPPEGSSATPILTLYDIQNKFVAFSSPVPHFKYIFTQNFKILQGSTNTSSQAITNKAKLNAKIKSFDDYDRPMVKDNVMRKKHSEAIFKVSDQTFEFSNKPQQPCQYTNTYLILTGQVDSSSSKLSPEKTNNNMNFMKPFTPLECFVIREKPLGEKLQILFSKNLYTTALNLAQTHLQSLRNNSYAALQDKEKIAISSENNVEAPPSTDIRNNDNNSEDAFVLAKIHKIYGDFLYAKSDYSSAMIQYRKTLVVYPSLNTNDTFQTYLEPSYIIRRFLGTPTLIKQLTGYLEQYLYAYFTWYFQSLVKRIGKTQLSKTTINPNQVVVDDSTVLADERKTDNNKISFPASILQILELILNCFIKLSDTAGLDRFLVRTLTLYTNIQANLSTLSAKNKYSKNNFDHHSFVLVEKIVNLLISHGTASNQQFYQAKARDLAQMYGLTRPFLKIEIEYNKNYDSALSYLNRLLTSTKFNSTTSTLNNTKKSINNQKDEIMNCIRTYGKELLIARPKQTINILVGLCTSPSFEIEPESLYYIFSASPTSDDEHLCTFLEDLILELSKSSESLLLSKKSISKSYNIYNMLFDIYMMDLPHQLDHASFTRKKQQLQNIIRGSSKMRSEDNLLKLNVNQALLTCQKYLNTPISSRDAINNAYDSSLQNEFRNFIITTMDYLSSLVCHASKAEDNDANTVQQTIEAQLSAIMNSPNEPKLPLNAFPNHSMLQLLRYLGTRRFQNEKNEIQNLTYSTFKDYFIQFFTNYSEKCDSIAQKVTQLNEQITQNEAHIKDLVEKPQIYQSQKCSGCGHSLDTPAIYFPCQHAYHSNCFETYNTNNTNTNNNNLLYPANSQIDPILSVDKGSLIRQISALGRTPYTNSPNPFSSSPLIARLQRENATNNNPFENNYSEMKVIGMDGEEDQNWKIQKFLNSCAQSTYPLTPGEYCPICENGLVERKRFRKKQSLEAQENITQNNSNEAKGASFLKELSDVISVSHSHAVEQPAKKSAPTFESADNSVFALISKYLGHNDLFKSIQVLPNLH